MAASIETAWQRLSAGDGTKGPRLYDWVYSELADLDAPARSGETTTSLWTRGLLIRRTLADGALAHVSTWCPHGTEIAELAEIEGHRWSVEDDVETGKNKFGLDHHETRSWQGWHRHVSLSMSATSPPRPHQEGSHRKFATVALTVDRGRFGGSSSIVGAPSTAHCDGETTPTLDLSSVCQFDATNGFANAASPLRLAKVAATCVMSRTFDMNFH